MKRGRVFITASIGLLMGVLHLAAEPPEEKVPPPSDPITPMKEDTPADRAQRIVKSVGDVSKSLGERDAGMGTQQRQNEILKQFDELLKPPPMPPKSQSSSSGGGGGGQSSKNNNPSGGSSSGSSGKSSPNPQPMNGGGSKSNPMPQTSESPNPMPQKGNSPRSSEGMSRREKRAQQQAKRDNQGENQPMPMTKGQGGSQGNGPMVKGQPMPMGGQPMPMGGQPMNPMGQPMNPMGLASDEPPPPNQKPNRIADLGRGIWGHLPDTLRQELDLYYRDQFMPRHSDLLREYYSNIAEGDRPRRRE